jgi:hypothetical protein
MRALNAEHTSFARVINARRVNGLEPVDAPVPVVCAAAPQPASTHAPASQPALGGNRIDAR